MEIREYESKYLSHIFKINKECHEQPESNLGLLEQIHKSITWIATEGDIVVGFLVSTYKQAPYIYNVSVLPEYRNKGIATALFNKCHEFYSQQKDIYLYVDTNNPAQKLYFDLGYRVIDLKRCFYGQDKDALVMLKTFLR